MSKHSWCQDVSRDEAVRAAEDAAAVPAIMHRDLPEIVADLRERVARLEAAQATIGSGDVFADVGCGSTGDEIARLTAEITRLREERRWIPVGERLHPVQGEDALVAQGPWDDGSYSLDIGWWNGTQWMLYRGAWDTPPVAFWQTLPQPPSEGEVE